jgi:competence ComEA-like helix-hairpin-helix protein
MPDPESRALAWAASILLLASLLRVGWARLHVTPASLGDTDVAHELLEKSSEELAELESRSRPLMDGEQIDPNRATSVELDRLPGVGPSTADAIVRSRDQEGPFGRPEDLTRVRGIGPATVARIADHLDFTTPVLGRARAPAGPVPVDLNRASAEALQELPGVGPALARRIVEARAAAPFRSVEDLARVRGIGPVAVERLRGRVTVGRR